jgi:hypothetical protein
MEAGMRVEEIALLDPGQDGPPWLWTGPGFPPEEGARIRHKCARTLLNLQRQHCMSDDPIHALTAWTWAQLYHVPAPPWVEVTVAQLAWAAIMAPTVIRGRRRRQVHWLRFAAVNDHLRRQRDAGVKRLSKAKAYRDVSLALRGQPGRGDRKRIEASYLLVANAIRRGEVNRFALGVLDNRYRHDVFGNERKPRLR